MLVNDRRRYVDFFKASLPFFSSYEELLSLWKEQDVNRRNLGISLDQDKEMRQACLARRREIENTVVQEYIPQRPGRT